MPIVLTRIDNRLIHGQILETWLPYVHANCLVVANDDIAGSHLKRMMMEASVPSRIKVVIEAIPDVVAMFARGEFESLRVLLLFASTSDSLGALRRGLNFERLNLGNLHAGSGKKQYSCTVFLDPEDIENLEQLDATGIDISARCIPADMKRHWRKLVPGNKAEN